MLKCSAWISVFSAFWATGLAQATWAAEPMAIVGPKTPSFAERLAAKEVRRYIYLRTGRLLAISDALPAADRRTLIVVGNQAQPLVRDLLGRGKAAAGRSGGKG